MIKKRSALIFLLFATIFSPVRASAYELTLSNENLDDGVNIAAGIQIITGEIYAARFEAPADAYPMTLKSIQVLMVPNPSSLGVSCAGFELVIWKDGGTLDAGNVIIDTQTLGTDGQVVLINGQANTIQEVSLQGSFGDVTLEPIEIDSGAIRIGLREAGPCPENASGQYFAPVMINDPTTAPANNSFLYGNAGTGFEWFSVGNALLGSKGEFVFRLVVDASGTPPPADTTSTPDTTPAQDSGSSTSDPGTQSDTPTPPEDTSAIEDTASVNDSAQPPSGAAPEVTDVLPRTLEAGVATDISITGANFVDGAKVELIPGGHTCSIKSVGEKVINAIVPATVEPGVYGVVVTNPDDQQGLINGILTVTGDDTSGTGGGGCTAGSTTDPSTLPVLLVLALMWHTIRRRQTEDGTIV